MVQKQHEWVRGDWMQTHTGQQFYPLDPKVEDIDTVDIAHALANICRFGGHVDKFYSVAEHSVLVSKNVPKNCALQGLLHDAAEAYVGDMVRPLKRSMLDFQRAEDKILACIFKKYGVPTYWSNGKLITRESVKEADNRILLDERAALMRAAPPVPWNQDLEALEPLGVRIVPMSPTGAEMAFLQRLTELTDVI